MQKKIIALAIAAALTAPAMAFAEATVYGQANLSVDMVNDGAASSTTTNRLVSNNSRLGFKGSEDLGGGLSAIWQMEGTVGMDSFNSVNQGSQVTALFNRNTFLGLKSADMGTAMVGINDTPYKSSTRRLDVFGDIIAADNRGLAGVSMMGNGVHDIRPNNTITYVSPSMSGLSVAASTVFGAETATSANPTKGSLLSLAGMYDQGPIFATLAYQTIKKGSPTSGDQAGAAVANVGDKNTAFKVGGSYKIDAFTVGAVVEKITATAASTSAETKNTNFYVAGKFNLSSTDAVKLAYTKRGATTGATNDATQVAVGYDHGMSKSTTVYALYTKVTQNATNAPDPSTLSVGMKYAF